MLTRRISLWATGRQKKWMGISLVGVFRIEGIMRWREHAYGTPYIFYQPELSVLVSDCFHMSFKSGAEFCSSHTIRGFLCQDTANWMPELEFKVYHST